MAAHGQRDEAWAMRIDLLHSATRVSRALLGVLLPLRCLVCGDPGHDDLDLCRACLAGLPWAGRACLRCALPLPDEGLIVCGSCREEAPPQTATHASLLYLPPVDQLLLRYKFHQDLAAGRLLAQAPARLQPGCRALPAAAVAGLAGAVPAAAHRTAVRTHGRTAQGKPVRCVRCPRAGAHASDRGGRRDDHRQHGDGNRRNPALRGRQRGAGMGVRAGAVIAPFIATG